MYSLKAVPFAGNFSLKLSERFRSLTFESVPTHTSQRVRPSPTPMRRRVDWPDAEDQRAWAGWRLPAGGKENRRGAPAAWLSVGRSEYGWWNGWSGVWQAWQGRSYPASFTPQK